VSITLKNREEVMGHVAALRAFVLQCITVLQDPNPDPDPPVHMFLSLADPDP
jgi:hypothetical protein